MTALPYNTAQSRDISSYYTVEERIFWPHGEVDCGDSRSVSYCRHLSREAELPLTCYRHVE